MARQPTMKRKLGFEFGPALKRNSMLHGILAVSCRAPAVSVPMCRRLHVNLNLFFFLIQLVVFTKRLPALFHHLD